VPAHFLAACRIKIAADADFAALGLALAGQHLAGMSMIDVSDVAMLFVRCRGRINSHHPDEHVETLDADAGARVLPRLIENFRPRE
jgi:allantoate deiminase